MGGGVEQFTGESWGLEVTLGADRPVLGMLGPWEK